MIVGDEVGFLIGKNGTLFTEILLPMMVVKHRAMLTITTAPDEGEAGGYGELFTIVDDDGRPAFKIYALSAVCAKCAARGVKGRCKCNAKNVPPHHSAERIAVVGKLLARMGRSGANEREITGRATRSTDKCFSLRSINMAFNTVRYQPREHVQFPFAVLAIDPCNGGTQTVNDHSSDFAILSAYLNLEGEMVVFGTTAWPAIDDFEFPDKLREHVRRLRAYPPTAGSQIVVVPECLSGLIHSAIVRTLDEMNDPNLEIMDEAKLKRGIPTNARIKAEMMRSMRVCLDKGLIRVDANFWSGSPGVSGEPERDVRKLAEQLKAYREIPGHTTNPVSIPAPHYSGKPNKDDLCVALQLARYFLVDVFFVSPKYLRRRVGWLERVKRRRV